MMNKTLLHRSLESEDTFMEKANKDNDKFVGDSFVEEAKENSQFKDRLRLSEQLDKKQDQQDKSIK